MIIHIFPYPEHILFSFWRYQENADKFACCHFDNLIGVFAIK